MGKAEDEFKIIIYYEDIKEYGIDPSKYGVSYKGEIVQEFYHHENGRGLSKAFIMGYCYSKGIKVNIYRIKYVEEELKKVVDNG